MVHTYSPLQICRSLRNHYSRWNMGVLGTYNILGVHIEFPFLNSSIKLKTYAGPIYPFPVEEEEDVGCNTLVGTASPLSHRDRFPFPLSVISSPILKFSDWFIIETQYLPLSFFFFFKLGFHCYRQIQETGICLKQIWLELSNPYSRRHVMQKRLGSVWVG